MLTRDADIQPDLRVIVPTLAVGVLLGLFGLWYWLVYGTARALSPLGVQVEVVRDLAAGHDIAADDVVVTIDRYGDGGTPIRAPRQQRQRLSPWVETDPGCRG